MGKSLRNSDFPSTWVNFHPWASRSLGLGLLGSASTFDFCKSRQSSSCLQWQRLIIELSVHHHQLTSFSMSLSHRFPMLPIFERPFSIAILHNKNSSWGMVQIENHIPRIAILTLHFHTIQILLRLPKKAKEHLLKRDRGLIGLRKSLRRNAFKPSSHCDRGFIAMPPSLYRNEILPFRPLRNNHNNDTKNSQEDKILVFSNLQKA